MPVESGVYFEIVGSGTRIKVREDFIENSTTKIIGIVPVLLALESYRVVVVTQFNGSANTFLKKPRTITSRFELTTE